jgi:hypothetical protein
MDASPPALTGRGGEVLCSSVIAAPNAALQVIGLEPARVADAESQRYGLYRNEFRDIREDAAPHTMPRRAACANEIHDIEECDQLSDSTFLTSVVGSVPWT